MTGETSEDFTPLGRSLIEGRPPVEEHTTDRQPATAPEHPAEVADSAMAAAPMSLEIMGSEYRIACPPDERDALLAAAEYLNAMMEDIRGSGKVLGVDRIAVMAALNISHELLNTQRQLTQQENAFNERLERLLRLVDVVLNKLRANGV